jgi:hypothetical protein
VYAEHHQPLTDPTIATRRAHAQRSAAAAQTHMPQFRVLGERHMACSRLGRNHTNQHNPKHPVCLLMLCVVVCIDAISHVVCIDVITGHIVHHAPVQVTALHFSRLCCLPKPLPHHIRYTKRTTQGGCTQCGAVRGL